MDFISIPQTLGLLSEAHVRTALNDQAKAVWSIPYYIKNSGNFWICAPSTLGRDGVAASYESWAARGWCRLEDVTNTLTKLGDGRALLVTHLFGERPALTADRILVYSQRYNAVLTGAYSCCQRGHRRTLIDGTTTERVDCDKVAIRGLLANLYEAAMTELRKDFIDLAELRSLGNIWGCVVQKNISFHKYVQLSVTRPMLLAESLDEQDWVALGWSVPYDRIGETELSAYWAHYGLQWPQPESAMVIPALEGNLPMLRYFIERAGCSAACASPSGLSPLIAAARGGHRAVVCYLCERLTVAEINFQTADSGLSALADAARRNHPMVLRELLKHGASVDIRRSDGKTPYLLAVREGHALCASILLAAGADPCSADYDGHSASDLIAMNTHLTNRWELFSMIQSHGPLVESCTLDTSRSSPALLIPLPPHLRRDRSPVSTGSGSASASESRRGSGSTGSAPSSPPLGTRALFGRLRIATASACDDEPASPYHREPGFHSAPMTPTGNRSSRQGKFVADPLNGAEQAHIRFAS
jgi:ankyrin repeat protein